MRSFSGSTALILLVGCLLCGLAGRADGQILQPDPSQSWREIVSPHFTVHYVAGSDSLAERLSEVAESTYECFRDDLGLEPGGRVEVYLQQNYDIVNSLSAVHLHRSVFIFPSPPYGVPHGLLAHHGDWMQLAFVHEYAHILDLEQRNGLWELIHLVTGMGYPNMFRPLWLSEGFAVWSESWLTNCGRVGSPTGDMIIRSDMLAGRYRDRDQWSGAADPWPSPRLPYVYGAAFMDYLAENHGPAAPVIYSDRTAGSIPWSPERPILMATRGKPFALFYHEFLEHLRRKADDDLEWIEEQGSLVEGEPIAAPGTVVLDVVASGNGRDLYVAFASDTRQSGIEVFDTDTREARILVDTYGSDISVSEDLADGRVVYSDLGVRASSHLVSSLLEVSLNGGRGKEVTRRERLHEPALSPTDGTLLACERRGETSRLVQVKLEEVERLRTGVPVGANVFDPSWSPDGSRVVVSVSGEDGGQNIWLVEYPSGRAHPLTDDEHWDISPTFSADGRHVFFSSDRNGLWNIYGIDLSGAGVFRITNVSTGAFLPAASRDGRWLYFARYGPDGDDVRRLPLEPSLWARVGVESQPRLSSHENYLARLQGPRRCSPDLAGTDRAASPADRPDGPPSTYSLADRLRFASPVVRIPLPTYDEAGSGLGVLLAGGDPLGRCYYSGVVSYGFKSGRLSHSVAVNSYLVPRLRFDVEISDVATPTSDDLGELNESFWRRDQTVDLSVAWPHLEFAHSMELQVGLVGTRTRAMAPGDSLPTDLPPPGFFVGRTTEYYGAFSFSNARRHALSFSLEDGISVRARLGFREKTLGGERYGDIAEFDVRGYRRLTDHLVVAIRGVGVRSSAADVEFGQGGDVWIDGMTSVIKATHVGVGSAEVRFRIMEIQRKTLGDWFFLNRAHCALFYELARYHAESLGEWRAGSRGECHSWHDAWSVGGRLSVDVTASYMFPATLDLTVAHTDTDGPSVSLGIGSAF